MGGAIFGSGPNFKRARPSFVPSQPDKYYQHHRYDKYRELPTTEHPIWALAVADETGIIAAATADHQVHLWDLATCELRVSLKAHTANVLCVAFSPNESTLATASEDCSIRLWEADTGNPVGLLRGHSNSVRSIAFSRHGLLLSGSSDCTLAVWECNNTVPVKQWQAHDGEVFVVSFLETDPSLGMSLGADGSVAVWRVLEGEHGLVARFPGGDGSGVLCLEPHPLVPGVIATGNEDGGVWLWFWSEGAVKDSITGHQHLRGHAQAVWSVAFSYAGSVLASASSDRMIRVWSTYDLTMPHLIRVFTAHDAWVRCIRWRTDPKTKRNFELVSASVDGTIAFWKTPKMIRSLAKLAGVQAQPPPDAGQAAENDVDQHGNEMPAGPDVLDTSQVAEVTSPGTFTGTPTARGARWGHSPEPPKAAKHNYRISPLKGGAQGNNSPQAPLFNEQSAVDTELDPVGGAKQAYQPPSRVPAIADAPSPSPPASEPSPNKEH